MRELRTAKARADLGYAPILSVADGMREMTTPTR